MYYSKEAIERISNNISWDTLVTSLGGRASKKAKGLFHCPHPDHPDKNPSFLAKTNFGTCLSGCPIGKGVSKVKLVEKVTGKKLPQSMEYLQKLQGITLKKEASELIKNKQQSQHEANKHSKIPTTTPLNWHHTKYLHERFGKHAQWLVETFNIRGYWYHLDLPIQDNCHVFIPLNKTKDQLFYRGENRYPQRFPAHLNNAQTVTHLVICEGEKDVLKATCHFKENGLLKTHAAITNTHGAQNIPTDFLKGLPQTITHITIAYDHDDIGREANKVVKDLCHKQFDTADIDLLTFPENKPKGYDLTDYLNEGHTPPWDPLCHQQKQTFKGYDDALTVTSAHRLKL